MGDLKSHRAILSKGFLWLAFLAAGFPGSWLGDRRRSRLASRNTDVDRHLSLPFFVIFHPMSSSIM